MNPNQLVNMLIRMFTRKAINQGMRHGINRAAGKGKPMSEMTPEERKKARALNDGSKQARRAMRMTRRMGKF